MVFFFTRGNITQVSLCTVPSLEREMRQKRNFFFNSLGSCSVHRIELHEWGWNNTWNLYQGLCVCWDILDFYRLKIPHCMCDIKACVEEAHLDWQILSFSFKVFQNFLAS